MPALKWDENLLVGVRSMDVEHKRLASIFGRLLYGLQRGDEENLKKNLDILAEKAAKHFSHEERLLRLTDYPATGTHEREHARLLSKVHEVRLGFLAGEAGTLSAEVVHGLWDLLEQHIKDSDKQFSTYLNLRGIR